MISYAVTVHNENLEYIFPLFERLLKHKRPEDEIIVVDDYSDNSGTVDVLNQYRDKVSIHQHRLEGDFASHKNYLNSLCKGSYIFQIDADEMPHQVFLGVLPEIIMMNPTVELYTIPRINLVSNITPEDISRWGWHINDKSWINYPDRQTRIYKNSPGIKWQGKVHERIVGYQTHTDLPEAVEYSLLHIKSIERQKTQNEFYSNLTR